jgi:hypothetical protein
LRPVRRRRRPSSNDLNDYITVVATRDNTQVSVTNAAGIRASKTFAMIPASQFAVRFNLNAFDVLNLEAVANGNLTGSLLQSNLLIEVFVGHEGASLPSKAPDAVHVIGPTGLSHVENLLPASALGGTTYAITRSKPRLSPQAENDVLQLIATQGTTHLTFNPPPARSSCATLSYKQACQIEIATDTLITADQSVVAGHYWQSAIWSDTLGNRVGNGAPSFAPLVPAERFSKDHLFYSPPSFSENYAAVSVPQGGSLELDGVDSSSELAPLPGGAFLGATLVLSAGAHHIVCDPGCSVEAYGYGATSAYSYPAGLRIR